jgi:hypothetical protein
MYKNFWWFVESPLLYGEVNDDSHLDRIRFDGYYMPSDRPFDTVTITAETYRNLKWQPLTDSKGKPFFIELLINEDRWELKIGNSNWMKPVSLE